MSDNVSVSEDIAKIATNIIEKIIGYAYAGFLPLFFIYIENPEYIRNLMINISNNISALILILIFFGILIYIFYIRVLGAYFLFPMQHLLHFFLDMITKKRGNNQTSVIGLIHYNGVEWLDCRSVYTFMRENFFPQKARGKFDFEHAELHIIYLSMLGFICASIVVHNAPHQIMYRYIGMVCFAIAMIADTGQHKRESLYVKADIDKFRTFIRTSRLAVDNVEEQRGLIRLRFARLFRRHP